MAVGPKSIELNDEDKLRRLEITLDGMLRGAEPDYMNRVIVAAPDGLTSRLFGKLRLRYLQAGWSDVKYTSDQRDGDFLEFCINPTSEQVDSYYRH